MGCWILSFDQNKDDAPRRRHGSGHGGGEAAAPAPPTQKTPEPNRRRRPPNDVGDALKAAYDRALDEDIPPEMLDLLGKLG